MRPEPEGPPNCEKFRILPSVLPSLDSKASAQNSAVFIRYRQKELQEKSSLSDLRCVRGVDGKDGGCGVGITPLGFCFTFSFFLPQAAGNTSVRVAAVRCQTLKTLREGKCVSNQKSCSCQSMGRTPLLCFSPCPPSAPHADAAVRRAQQSRETKPHH